MRRTLLLGLVLYGLAPMTASGQTTVAIFPASAVDPNTAVPLAMPVSYTPTCSLAPKFVEALPITNPIEGYYDDPTNPALDCRVPLSAQFMGLPDGSGYKAAFRLGNGTYGVFSSAFASQAVHPCDGAPATSGTVIAGPRTLTWCHSGLDTNGSATTMTSWALYTNNVRSVLTGVSAPGNPNASGLRAYTATITTTAGSRVYEVAGVNAVAEGARSSAYTATVQAVAAPPAAPIIRGVQ